MWRLRSIEAALAIAIASAAPQVAAAEQVTDPDYYATVVTRLRSVRDDRFVKYFAWRLATCPVRNSQCPRGFFSRAWLKDVPFAETTYAREGRGVHEELFADLDRLVATDRKQKDTPVLINGSDAVVAKMKWFCKVPPPLPKDAEIEDGESEPVKLVPYVPTIEKYRSLWLWTNASAKGWDDLPCKPGALDAAPSPFQLAQLADEIDSASARFVAIPDGLAPTRIAELEDLVKKLTENRTHLLYELAARSAARLLTVVKEPGYPKDQFTALLFTLFKEGLEYALLLGATDPNELTQADYDNLVGVYGYLADLTFVMLAYGTPYQLKDYREAMASSLNARLPKADSITITHYPMHSGMDALATAYAVAATRIGSPGTSLHVESLSQSIYEDIPLLKEQAMYFEVQESLFGRGNQKNHHAPVVRLTGKTFARVVLAGLSTESSLDKVDLKAITTRLATATTDKPIVLIIDTTLEHARLDELLAQLKEQIASGKIDVLLVRSLQKYAALGTAKVKAGNLTLITRTPTNYSALEQYAVDTFSSRREELQQIVHLLKAGPGDEKRFYDESARTASRLQTVLTGMKLANSKVTGTFVHDRDTTEIGSLRDKLPGMDGFAYPFTTTTAYSVLRISAGLEPQVVLEDKLGVTFKPKKFTVKWVRNARDFRGSAQTIDLGVATVGNLADLLKFISSWENDPKNALTVPSSPSPSEAWKYRNLRELTYVVRHKGAEVTSGSRLADATDGDELYVVTKDEPR